MRCAGEGLPSSQGTALEAGTQGAQPLGLWAPWGHAGAAGRVHSPDDTACVSL